MHTTADPTGRRSHAIPRTIAAIVGVVLLSGSLLLWRAERRTNRATLSAAPKEVAYVVAVPTPFRARRIYVGTMQPWVQASLGPQLVSALVDTVLVRPGSVVQRGQVVATLDCRNASASSRTLAMHARSVDSRQQALAHESARIQSMLTGGYVSTNEAERVAAQSASLAAELAASQANLARSSLEVNDCILRAPFDGEIGARMVDPGAFVRPGTAIVTVLDRNTVRLVGNAPEADFAIVAPGTPIKVLSHATRAEFSGSITRRAPSADVSTRTIHFEIDLADPDRRIPVGTTGEIRIEVGEPVASLAIPVYAATVKGNTARLFSLVGGTTAKAVSLKVLGEAGSLLYLEPSLEPPAQIISEGRALLEDGDAVHGRPEGDAYEPNR